MSEHDELIRIIQGEAMRTRGLVVAVFGLALMLTALFIAASTIWATAETAISSALVEFWLSVLLVGPLGTMIVVFGWSDLSNGKRLVSLTLLSIDQSRSK